MFQESLPLLFGASALLIISLAVLAWMAFGPLKVATNRPLLELDARAFLGQLDIAVRSHLTIFPSIPVRDVLKAGRFSRSAVILRMVGIQQFDFVLYHRRKMEVRCVIKLIPYGSSHNSRAIQTLRRLCETAELPLLEYEMKPYRDVPQLRRTVLATCGIEELEIPDDVMQGSRKVMSELTVEDAVLPRTTGAQHYDVTNDKLMQEPEKTCPKCHST
ncbi:MAG: DUF2726 domain-containing protein, partial [Endozoicomonas sp.]